MQGEEETTKEASTSDDASGNGSDPASHEPTITRAGPLWKWPAPSAEWAMVLISIALLLTTYLQWRAARDAINQTERVIQLQSRAWLSVGVEPISAVQEGEVFDVRLTMTNSGETPALHVLPNIFMNVNYPTEETLDRFPLPPIVEADLGPGQNGTKNIKTSFLLSSELARGLEDGTQDIYVYGMIHYRDIFQAQHRTSFCYSTGDNGKLEFCQDFNRLE